MKATLLLAVIWVFMVNIGWGGEGEAQPDRVPVEDSSFHVTGYFGTAVDSFAAQDLKKYLNPEASGDTSAFERAIFGLDFRFDLGNRVSLFGETLHGVRSTDVDCEKTPDLCDGLSVTPTADKTLFILKSASSLEAFAGLRLDLLRVRAGGEVYVAGQLGFVTVSDSGQDVMDDHKVGIGVRLTEGRFQNSYLEFGYGRSQIFHVNPNRRFKIDGYLSIEVNDNTAFFAEMVVDSDFSNGADSIQSFYGIEFDIASFVRSHLGKKPQKDGGSSPDTEKPGESTPPGKS